MDYQGKNPYKRYYGGLAKIYVDACQEIREWRISASLDIVKEEEPSLKPAKDVTFRGRVELVFDRIEGPKPYQYGGVAGDIENLTMRLSGDPGLEVPYLPESPINLAAWGRGQIKVDGRTVYDNLNAFMMYTRSGSRDDETRRVLKGDQTCCYDPSKPQDGFIKAGDRELHFWFYSDETDGDNVPRRKVFVNVVFEQIDEVTMPNTGTNLLPNTGESR